MVEVVEAILSALRLPCNLVAIVQSQVILKLRRPLIIFPDAKVLIVVVAKHCCVRLQSNHATLVSLRVASYE
jgi:hypothetical protein